MKVGFVGLGRMGRAIAGRIAAAGLDLAVYNRTADKTREFADLGITVAGSVREACRGRDIVVTMLSDDAALDQVALGPDGVRAALAAGGIHMIMGTHGTAAVRACADRHAEQGQIAVNAPVLGRPDAAAAGQLGMILAGPPEALARCRPVIDAVARRVFEAGDRPEHAAVVKLANSLVLACAIEAMGEAFSLVRKHGVGAQVLYDVLTEGLFAAPAYKGYGKLIADEAYAGAGFTADLGLKEVRLILATADKAHVPLPGLRVLHDRLLSIVGRGDGGRDWACIGQDQARGAGLA